MEVLIIIVVIGGFGYVIYKVAKSKNREPSVWILAAFLLSPIIILIILACMQKLPKQKRSIKKITHLLFSFVELDKLQEV